MKMKLLLVLATFLAVTNNASAQSDDFLTVHSGDQTYLFGPGSKANTYQGFMYAEPWQNVTFQQADGTTWGNSTTAGAFKMVKHVEGDGLEHWGCWFAGTGTGDWLVTVDFNIEEWSCALVNSIEVNGDLMVWSAEKKAWQRAITTTTDNTTLALTGTALRSNYTTGGSGSEEISISTLLPSGTTIAKAGTYTVTLAIGEGCMYACSVEEGDQTGTEMAPIPTVLKVYDTDYANLLATLQPVSGKNGVFSGQITSTTAWMGFKVKDEDNDIEYGIMPDHKTQLSTASDKWNFWIDSDVTGVYDMEINLITMTWTHKYKGGTTIDDDDPVAPEDMPIIPTNKPTTDVAIATGAFTPDYTSASDWECPEWFKDAKFGIWAHWGPQCYAEDGDWYARHMYIDGDPANLFHREHFGDPAKYGLKEMCRDWKGQNWNPERLVNLYKSVGAKYFMAMANHHDNFDLWDSPYQEWNAVNLGPKQDLIKGWSEAAKAAGLPFGVSIHASHAWTWLEPSQDYDGKLTKADGNGKWWDGLDPQELYAQDHEHSAGYKVADNIIGQWNWGGGANQPSAAYKQKFQNRTLQLINDYKPDMVYFDDTAMPFYGCDDQVGQNILAHYYNSAEKVNGNPNVVVTGKQLTNEQKDYMLWDVERGIPDRIIPEYWQTCTCIGSWHYDTKVYSQDSYKSAQQVICMMVDIVSKNGNLLLSVPVRSDGTIDDKEEAVLADIKAWLDINGEGIYGTRPWKTFGEGPLADNVNPLVDQGFNEENNYSAQDVRYVQKDGVVYATIMQWPATQAFTFKSLGSSSGYYNGKVKSVRLLGAGDVSFTEAADGVTVTLPVEHPNEIAPVLQFTFESGTTGIQLTNVRIENAPAEYFSLTGARLSQAPHSGVYMIRQGTKTRKVLVK